MVQDAAGLTPDRSSRLPVHIAIVAIVAGTALRVVEFARDRPLWLDEAMLALNVAGRSIGQLAQPLDYDQSAPLLYLWVERLAVSLGGVSERTLRLLPFVAGVGLLAAIWVVARRLAGPTAAAIATLLAALSVTLVTFSAEAKQYGVDPLVTLLAVWLAVRVRDVPANAGRWGQLAAGGVGCLLASQPALFTLGGVLLALVADADVRRSDRFRRRLAAIAVLWGVAFVALYLGVYRTTAQSAYMHRFWEGTFLDLRAPDLALRFRLFAMAAFVAPTPAASTTVPPTLLALAWVAGVTVLWRRHRFAAIVVSVPLALAAAASSVGMYPVIDRLFLFVAPLTLIVAGALVAGAIDLVAPPRRVVALAAACAAIVLSVAVTHARRLANPVFYGVGKQVVADVDSMSRGEPVYIAARSFPLWVFYTTDWRAPDAARLRWAASIGGAGGPAHNNAPSRGRVRSTDGDSLVRRYRGRTEIVGLPTGRQYLTSTRTLNPRLSPKEYALPLEPDSGWAEREVTRMAAVARPRLWVFGSHMFALDGAEPGLVAELQRRGVRLVMERRQGTTVGYHVEFSDAP